MNIPELPVNSNLNDRQSVRDLQIHLATFFMQLQENERLPSVRDLAASTRMSLGAVSAALNGLQEMGAVDIQKRGKLGSRLTGLSMSKLWNLVEQGPMVIGLSLPMHSHFEGLATGIKKAFEQAGIEAYMIFIRGSRTRLKALDEKRCHVTVMSGLAADELTGRQHRVLLRLPPGSWISEYCVYYRPGKTGKPLRVAFDPDSFDHRRLTELEFTEQNVEFKQVSYMQIPRLLKSGELDATVWTTDQVEDYVIPPIKYRPLSERVRELVGERATSAAFVGRANDDPVCALCEAVLKAEEILAIQNQVVANEIVPEY